MITTHGLTPELFREENREARFKLILDAVESEEELGPPPNTGASLSRCIMVLHSLANRFVVDPSIQALGSKSLPKAPCR